MSVRTRTITIDEETAAAIESRAAELGVTTSQLLALAFASQESVDDDDAIVMDLEARWGRVLDGGGTVPHDQVALWLETWGKPGFKPWGNGR